MGWVKDALKELAAGRKVQVRPSGGSMRGRIESGQLVTLSPAQPGDVHLEDVVLVRWQGNYLLHLVKAIQEGQFLIGNNVGKINGWVSGDAIVARVSAVGELVEGTEVSVGVIALDLERTLIDDARSGRPRPGLLDFLTFCHERFERVALFTTVEEEDARDVLEGLARRDCLPPGLLDRLEYVGWSGEYKDLEFVPGAVPEAVLLVDDDGGWVRPDQRDRWVAIAGWDGGPDRELERVRSILEGWLAGSAGSSDKSIDLRRRSGLP